MKRITFCIPSKGRCNNQKALKYLRKIGVPRSDIYICTQTEKDYAEYTEKWGSEANVVYKKTIGVAANRNFALTIEPDAYQIQLDDVVGELIIKTGKWSAKKIKTRDVLLNVLQECFRYASSLGASTFSFNASGHPMRLTDTECINHPSCPICCAFLDRSTAFDERILYYEDVERGLRLNAYGKTTIRFDNIGPRRLHNDLSGGCQDARPMKRYYARIIAQAYPGRVKEKNGALVINNKSYTRRAASLDFKSFLE